MLKRKKKRGSRRIQLDDASAESFVAGLVEAAAAIRLPELFAKPHPRAIFSVPNRCGIAVTALRTTDLSEQQLVDLLRFRLAQYLEVNFVDPNVVYGLAEQIAQVARSGVQVAVVVGGGNFFRGAELQQRGMDRDRADYMGMLGTVMNCLALQDFLEKLGTQTRVQTAITMGQVAEPYIPRRAERHLEKGRVVIFGAGAGMPYFSTDTVAAQRALELSAEVLLMGKQGVDGVYSADPHKHPEAVKFDDLTYDEYLARNLKVADATAVSMARDYKLPMIFFSLDIDGTIVQVVSGEKIGTTVHA